MRRQLQTPKRVLTARHFPGSRCKKSTLNLKEPRHGPRHVGPRLKAHFGSQRPRNVTEGPRSSIHTNRSKMTADFNGKWKLVDSENFDAYLQAVGVNFMIRQMAKAVTPRQEIQQNGDNFVIKSSGFQTKVTNFTIGEEFEDDSPIGKVKVKATWDGGKLHFDIDSPKGKLVNDREIRADGRMYLVMKAANGATCTRIFAKQ
ncbi:sodium/calcium exchanger regulatory protein 1-like isoform X2 [Branchiostoma lanceolatum]|uniref:sodium/calcium exchanger regulatory protein 1-like isoform X2 n=1 Tax=Branchiostoma lanceolatum TaxID=7740 RepID=UPI003453799E